MRTILFLLLFPVTIYSQSLSVSPTSFKGWGQTPGMSELSVSYKNVSIHYFYVYRTYYGYYRHRGELVYAGHSQSTFAISYLPVSIYDIVRAGVMLSEKNFPLENGAKLNFWLEGGVDIGRFRISYVHISNGFGILHELNPGMDTIRFTVNL
ncbi:MAG: hypothetical protein WD355_04465 [Balneolaceae bacterium]